MGCKTAENLEPRMLDKRRASVDDKVCFTGEAMRVRLRTTFGFSWRTYDGEQSALWAGYEIKVLSKAGSHRFCEVSWGTDGVLPHVMYGWIHKKELCWTRSCGTEFRVNIQFPPG